MPDDFRFPPGGLPRAEGRLFRMAYDLAFRKEYSGAPEVLDTGMTTAAAVRKLGAFEIRVELQTTVSREKPSEDMTRLWLWIWHDGALVFDAWCSKISATGAVMGFIQKCEEGEWKYHLRIAHEKDERV